MNKFKKILLAILGATDVVMSIIMPILVSILWVRIFGFTGWGSYVLYGIGLTSSMYRGYNIGFLGEQ